MTSHQSVPAPWFASGRGMRNYGFANHGTPIWRSIGGLADRNPAIRAHGIRAAISIIQREKRVVIIRSTSALFVAALAISAFAAPSAALTVEEFNKLQAAARSNATARNRYEVYLRGVRDTLIVFNVELGEKKTRRFCLPKGQSLSLAQLERLIVTEAIKNARIIKKYPKLEVALVALVALEETYPCPKEQAPKK